MKKILMVDDVRKIREIYTKLLATEGFAVIQASNAGEAQEILRQENIDLILLDIKMPELDSGAGITMCEVRRLSQKKSKIIVTGVDSWEEQKQNVARASGYYDKQQGIDILLAKGEEAVREG